VKEDIRIFSQFGSAEHPLNVYMMGISYCDRTYRIERSEYDRYVIEYTVDGEGTLETAGQRFTVRPGDTYFLYSGIPHKYYCSGERWEKLWVVVDGPLAKALFQNYLPDHPYVLSGLNIKRYMYDIIETGFKENISYSEMTEQVALTVHKILIESARRDNNRIRLLPERIKEYIDERIGDPMSLDGMAKEFHYSKNHLINVFREKYGCTPYSYYEVKRLEAAKELLMWDNESVSEISDKMGFDSPQYFFKRFKKVYGVTPTQMRKSRR